MPQSQVDAQAARNAAIVALALRQLAGLWPQVDWESPAAVQAVTAVYTAIVTRYGRAAAAVAAQAYDESRAAKGLTSEYRAVPADPFPQAAIDKAVQSAFAGVGPVGDERTAKTTSGLPVDVRVPTRLEEGLQRHVLQPARNTIAENTAADPAKPVWIRVPKGATTCAFCVMLASRKLGPNFTGYQSRQNALFREKGDKFHKRCDCEAVALYPGDGALDVSPNMSDFQDMYEKAAADAGTHSDANKILAAMRKRNGLK
jgi:hypothetical protein